MFSFLASLGYQGSRVLRGEFMNKINISQLQYKWIEKEKIKIESDKKRRYLHFDSRITTISQNLLNEIFDPDYVTRRFFYLFIHDIQITRKYKKKDNLKYIDKKERPLCYASHKDAFIFSWYAYVLDHLYERKIKELIISKNVIAYRSLGCKTIDFAKEVFDFIKKKNNCVTICFDIKGFFDNLNHKQLKKVWRTLLLTGDMLDNKNLPNDHYAIYKAITNYSYISKNNLFDLFGINEKNKKQFSKICSLSEYKKIRKKANLIKHNIDKGIPQGIAMSSVLSNAYMMEFDVNVVKFVNKLNGFYRRYCDDIIIVCGADEYENVIEYIKSEINSAKLEIQEAKTEIRFFNINDKGMFSCTNKAGENRSLQYLGIKTDGNKEWLREKTVAKNYRKITRAVKKEYHRLKKTENNFAKRKLYKKFVYSNRRSFLSYAKSAVKILNSKTLKKQIEPNGLVKLIRRKIKKYKK